MYIRLVLYALLVVTGATLLSPGVSAQYARKDVFVGPAWDTTSAGKQTAYVAGGGIEELFGNHLGAGLELNAVIPGSGNANTTTGVASFNGYGHLLRDSNWDPLCHGRLLPHLQGFHGKWLERRSAIELLVPRKYGIHNRTARTGRQTFSFFCRKPHP